MDFGNRPQRIPSVQGLLDTINARLIFRSMAAKKPIPDNENGLVILVDILAVDRMMNAAV